MLTPRDLSKCRVGQGRYALITAENGGIVNDPVLLRLGENHFWLAVADSDALLWAKGVALHSEMRVEIREPDISPLQVQGPKSKGSCRHSLETASSVYDMAKATVVAMPFFDPKKEIPKS